MSKDPFEDREIKKSHHPIPSREFILALLEKRKKSATRDEIAKELNITTKERETLRRYLRAMERDGLLVFTRPQRYFLPEHPDLIRGKVIGHRDGYGFLRVEGDKDDFYLSNKQMKFCLHGDFILAQIISTDSKARREVRVIRILEPRNSYIVGRYCTNSGTSFVVPDDNRLNFDVLIAQQTNTDSLKTGLIVVVKIMQRPTYRTKAIGEITEVLGDSSNMGTNLIVDMALRTYEIPYTWSEKVKKEVDNFKLNDDIPECEKKDRIDLRHLPFVTIDGEDARDLDDAVYCEKKSDGTWKLWVAIADVSYYVRPGSMLDNEAYKRGTSVYFPSCVVPMLPEVLSNNLCSLNYHMDRLCMICEMNISAKGKLIDYKHYEAVIKSYACLTYNKVFSILKGDSALRSRYKELVKHLEELYCLYQTLEIARKKRGGISFKTEEAKFIFNADKRIERVERTMRNDVHKLIEECMILANIASASFVEKNEEPTLFRDHDRPSVDSINSFHSVLKELGLSLQGGLKPQPIDYADLLTKIADRPDAEMLQTMLLRSMKQAVYDPENRGHFGLALTSYAHFTSPIRRYPDLLLHRTIKYLLLKEKINLIGQNTTPTGGYHYNLQQMLKLGQHCSMTERRAEEATRDASDWLKCDFMQNQVGNIFHGIISSVTNFGFFVRLNDLFIDGLVHISTLNNDYYNFDQVGQRLIGTSGGNIYRLGDSVEVRLNAVHMDERKIDFTLITTKNLVHRKCKNINKRDQKIIKKVHRNCKNLNKNIL
ncbi:ribonuclease R [Candidatus Pantoea carbekii]|uniref:ribonuclease R n=1 Tax=Candidatus Pantoea carbekii TaxID=1235990 RepID=UPI00061876C0|nr:ribonuclease R [Candidatus Pantoea carbekii]AKC32526.1 ribonuclease R [Candidatus Pantoea carbekii]